MGALPQDHDGQNSWNPATTLFLRPRSHHRAAACRALTLTESLSRGPSRAKASCEQKGPNYQLVAMVSQHFTGYTLWERAKNLILACWQQFFFVARLQKFSLANSKWPPWAISAKKNQFPNLGKKTFTLLLVLTTSLVRPLVTAN